jgi:hypothetical protein
MGSPLPQARLDATDAHAEDLGSDALTLVLGATARHGGDVALHDHASAVMLNMFGREGWIAAARPETKRRDRRRASFFDAFVDPEGVGAAAEPSPEGERAQQREGGRKPPYDEVRRRDYGCC